MHVQSVCNIFMERKFFLKFFSLNAKEKNEIILVSVCKFSRNATGMWLLPSIKWPTTVCIYLCQNGCSPTDLPLLSSLLHSLLSLSLFFIPSFLSPIFSFSFLLSYIFPLPLFHFWMQTMLRMTETVARLLKGHTHTLLDTERIFSTRLWNTCTNVYISDNIYKCNQMHNFNYFQS